MDEETLETELILANAADGVLPSFLSELPQTAENRQAQSMEILAIDKRVAAMIKEETRGRDHERAAITKQDMIKTSQTHDLTRADIKGKNGLGETLV